MTTLSLASLARLPKDVKRPRYARDQLRGGIPHIGVGNFHRGQQAVYLDRLFNGEISIISARSGSEGEVQSR